MNFPGLFNSYAFRHSSFVDHTSVLCVFFVSVAYSERKVYGLSDSRKGKAIIPFGLAINFFFSGFSFEDYLVLVKLLVQFRFYTVSIVKTDCVAELC